MHLVGIKKLIDCKNARNGKLKKFRKSSLGSSYFNNIISQKKISVLAEMDTADYGTFITPPFLIMRIKLSMQFQAS